MSRIWAEESQSARPGGELDKTDRSAAAPPEWAASAMLRHLLRSAITSRRTVHDVAGRDVLTGGLVQQRSDSSAVAAIHEAAERIRANVGQVIVGAHDTVTLVLVALLGNGHVLLEDVPGTGVSGTSFSTPALES